jgi:hypothetical protein
MRFFWLAMPILVFGCTPSSQPFKSNAAVTNLKAQAVEVERAMINEDHDRMANLTHPALVNYIGGRAKMILKLEEAATDMRQQGIKVRAFVFGEPSELLKADGEIYAIYPYTLELTTSRGETAHQPSYLVCNSKDDGVTWWFLDGEGVKSDRGRLKRFLPQFPAELALPESRPLIVNP